MIFTPENLWIGKEPCGSVFLAGPIVGARDWQAHAGQHLSKHPAVQVFNPRLYKAPEFYAQVAWETRWLSRVDVILFWLAEPDPEFDHTLALKEGRAYAQTTRFELGEWCAKAKRDGSPTVVIGGDKEFPGLRYIEQRTIYDGPSVIFLPRASLFETCDTALRVLEHCPPFGGIQR